MATAAPTPCPGTTYAVDPPTLTLAFAYQHRRCPCCGQLWAVGKGQAETACSKLAALHRATFGA